MSKKKAEDYSREPKKQGKVGNYLQYNWWKYALIIALSIFFWNLTFTMTEPRPAEDEKLELIVAYAYVDPVKQDIFAEQMQAQFPEMLQTLVTNIALDIDNPDDYAYQMQYVVRMAAQEGDIFFVHKDRLMIEVEQYALNLAELSDLPEYAELEKLPLIKAKTGEIIGVDIASLTGLTDALGFYSADCAAFLPIYCSNPQESAQFLLWLFANFAE